MVLEAALTDEQASDLEDWGGLTVSVGEPVEITLSTRIPRRGLILERTYAEPLAADAAATFAFFDERLGSWHAVPSTLSSDRRTLRATVHHLSLWTDIVGWTSGAVQNVADWTTYQIGKIFDTRVDPPKCIDPTPEWVDSAVFIETARNNPLLFCAGHDAKHPELLVVKARVNRGYGYGATVDVPTSWDYNSTMEGLDLNVALDVVGHPGEAAFDLLQAVMSDGTLVGPGQELSFGLDEAQLWSADTSAVLEMTAPDAVGFMVWLLSQLLMTELTVKADGLVAAVVGISGCVADLRDVRSPQSAVRALQSCASAIDEQLARQLAVVLDRRGVANPGRVAGKLVGKLSVYLAVLGPTFSGMTYFADTKLDEGARTVSVFGTTPPRVGANALRTAEVPESCLLPAQRLVDGRTTKGSPGGGWIETRSAHVDMADLGYRQALTTYGCTAGGVTWPETLVLIGEGGKLLAHYDLGDIGQHEHADVDRYRVEGDRVIVTWHAYEGAGSYVTAHRSEVSYSSGELLVSDEITSYGDAEGFAEAVVNAAAVNDKQRLFDPSSVPDDYWTILVNAIDGRDPIVLCDASGDSFDCGIAFEPEYEDEAYMFVAKRRGTWRVEYASTSVY